MSSVGNTAINLFVVVSWDPQTELIFIRLSQGYETEDRETSRVRGTSVGTTEIGTGKLDTRFLLVKV